MPKIIIDDIDVPTEERTLASRLQTLNPAFEIEITLRESGWIPHAVEHVRVFLREHSSEEHIAVGYVLKTIGDAFVNWAKERLRRAPDNSERLSIYGPGNKVLKTITVKRDSIEE